MTSQLEALDPRLQLGLHVDLVEKERIATLRGQQLPAGSVGIAIADETEGVAGVAGERGSDDVGRRALHHHAAADDIKGASLRQGAGLEFARKGAHLEILENLPRERQLLGLAGDVVVVVAEVDAEARGEDGAVDQPAELARVMQDGEDLLHAAERKGRNEHRTSALDGLIDDRDEPGHFIHPFLADGAGGVAPGGFHDERVKVVEGKLCRRAGALRLKLHVAGKEELPVFVVKLDAGGAGHVARLVKDDLDLVPRSVELLSVAVGQGREPPGAPIDLLVGE